MTYEPNDLWEETLNAYLEGRGLRADAEDLLMRLHLSPVDRDQIERSLRLTDELTLTLRQAQPPAGAQQRLVNKLAAHMSSESSPIDPSVINRLLGQPPQSRRTPPLPDVKAAEQAPEPPDDE
jgi:hypothetical protein